MSRGGMASVVATVALAIAIVLAFGGHDIAWFSSHSEGMVISSGEELSSQSVSTSKSEEAQGRTIDIERASERTEMRLRERYFKKVEQLSDRIEQEGLDPQRLNEQYLEQGRKVFLQKLTPKLRQDYEELFSAAAVLQAAILEQDGKPADFLDQAENRVDMQQWVEAKANKLEEQTLQPSINTFVNEVSKARKVQDEDVEELVDLCQSRVECIEKSVKVWIDANHLLTEEQFEILNRHL